MSSAGVGGLSAPPPPSPLDSQYVSTAHVNTMCLTTFGLCSMVVSSTLNLTGTVEPLLSDPLLSEFSIIQPQTHSPNSI